MFKVFKNVFFFLKFMFEKLFSLRFSEQKYNRFFVIVWSLSVALECKVHSLDSLQKNIGKFRELGFPNVEWLNLGLFCREFS
jgi:hypothetical protein